MSATAPSSGSARPRQNVTARSMRRRARRPSEPAPSRSEHRPWRGATAAEAKRDELKRSRSELLRERDEARKARDTAQQALNRERAARKADMADWKRMLEYAAAQLLVARQGGQEAEEEVRRLREQTPPTQVAGKPSNAGLP